VLEGGLSIGSNAGPMGRKQVSSKALQACLTIAMDESPGLITRWMAGVLETLRQHESWAVSPAQRADLSRALQQLSQAKQPFIERWVENWGNVVSEALRHPGQVGPPKRPLASINFDDLELMDDSQIQATVQVARLEQAVQGAAGDALSELNALVSRAQGFTSAKPEYNPLRPDVAVMALRLTMESVTRDKAVRTLWLQHGTDTLGQELQVLYRHLIRVLGQHGVTPAEYHVIQAPSATSVPRGGGSGRQRPPGLADQFHESSFHAEDDSDELAPSGLMTLDCLHDLLVTGPVDLHSQPVEHTASTSTLPMIDMPVDYLPPPDALSKRTGAPHSGKSASASYASAADDPASPLQALASEVVLLMLNGIARDPRLLQPVKSILHQLEPALLRIARDDPRFFVDKQNPARRLLDEITQRSLAFNAENAPGFAEFHATLEDLIPLLQRTDVRLTSLFETALDVLVPPDKTGDTRLKQDKERGRAVASLVQAEQRFLVADRVAKELSERRDFAMAHRLVRKFLLGPWAQVIAQARLAPAPAMTHPSNSARMPSDMRYLGVVSDLIWSSRAEAASRNRSRLARVIPGLLRTLREGLQTIDYQGTHSRHFFGALMGLHATALTVDPAGVQGGNQAGGLAGAPAVSAEGMGGDDGNRLWVKPAEAVDSGFMDSDFPTTRATLAEHSLPAGTAEIDVVLQDDSASDSPVPALELGAWIELCRESGDWVRLQLAWMSPHGLMYLFGSHGGRTSSMSRRAFEDMYRRERIRLVAAHSVVDDALDRVLDVATRNSARKPLPADHSTVYPDLLPPLS
jgi:hypothetical protein